MEWLAGIGGGERVLELAVDRRRHVEQRALEDLQAGAHFVDGRGTHAARLVGAVEGHDRLAQLGDDALTGACAGARIVEPVERGRDVGEMVEDGAPACLGRVRGHHRHDEEPLEQRAHVVGGNGGAAQLGGEQRDRAVGRLARAIAAPQDADAMLLFGGVDEVEEEREGARQELERAGVERVDLCGEGGATTVELTGAQQQRLLARVVDGGERGVAFVCANRLAQDAAEPLHVRRQFGVQLPRRLVASDVSHALEDTSAAVTGS